jgi:hypothetical protein
MENNTSNEDGLGDAAAARCEAFHQAIDKYLSKLDDSHHLVKSRSDYAALITILCGPAKDKKVKMTKIE